MNNEITIVWQRARNSVWEDSWVEYLFQNIPHKTIENLNHDQFVDNSVIVDAICWAPYHNDYILNLKSKGYKFGLIHLTDEKRTDDISSYQHCEFVLRNYYRVDMANNVMHIPLGWNTGFADILDNPECTKRNYTWALVAHRWDQNRNYIASRLNQISKGILYVAEKHGPRMSSQEMSKIYRNSIFVPCPSGAFVEDSFRVTEALEAGCIPIVKKSNYWFDMHGQDFPAIQLNHWEEINGVINVLMKDQILLTELQRSCYSWWLNKKKSLIIDVTEKVRNSLLRENNNE